MSVELCPLWNVNMIEWASKRRESRRAGEWIERGVMAYCDGRVPVPEPEPESQCTTEIGEGGSRLIDSSSSSSSFPPFPFARHHPLHSLSLLSSFHRPCTTHTHLSLSFQRTKGLSPFHSFPDLVGLITVLNRPSLVLRRDPLTQSQQYLPVLAACPLAIANTTLCFASHCLNHHFDSRL